MAQSKDNWRYIKPHILTKHLALINPFYIYRPMVYNIRNGILKELSCHLIGSYIIGKDTCIKLWNKEIPEKIEIVTHANSTNQLKDKNSFNIASPDDFSFTNITIKRISCNFSHHDKSYENDLFFHFISTLIPESGGIIFHIVDENTMHYWNKGWIQEKIQVSYESFISDIITNMIKENKMTNEQNNEELEKKNQELITLIEKTIKQLNHVTIKNVSELETCLNEISISGTSLVKFIRENNFGCDQESESHSN